MQTTCPLCFPTDEQLIYSTKLYRIIAPNNPTYPGYIQLITNGHFKEMTDLSEKERFEVFAALMQIEMLIQETCKADKINLAQLGNVVPHLHWHIIPRYYNDKHFPNSIWGKITHHAYIPSSNLLVLEQKLLNKLKNHFF